MSSCQPQRQVQSHSDYREGSYKAVLGLWDAGALAPAASATGRRGPRFPSENRSPVQKVPSSHFLREMDYEWEKREALCTYMDKSSPNLPFISHIFEIHFLILICEVFILEVTIQETTVSLVIAVQGHLISRILLAPIMTLTTFLQPNS